MSRSLEVWLDADLVTQVLQVGTLSHDRGQMRFVYEDAWLRHPLRFALDPDLSRRREAPMKLRTVGGSFSGLPCPIA